MDVQKLKRIIGHCNDDSELREIANAASKRRELLRSRAWKKRISEAWYHVLHLLPGTELHCCAEGTFFGGDVQRGHVAVIHSVQPRKKILWLKHEDGEVVGYPPNEVARYRWRTEPSEQGPLPEHERKAMKKMGAIL